MGNYIIYIMASGLNGTLYIGSTSDLPGRTWKHRESYYSKSFTAKYGVLKLVYYEQYEEPEAMVNRERTLKAYKRQWKINLIEKENPGWRDLYSQICA